MDVVTYFTILYYVVCIVPLLGFFMLAFSNNARTEKVVLQYLGIGFVVFLVAVVGFRPVGDGGFNDTQMYMDWLQNRDLKYLLRRDILFGLFTYASSYVLSARAFFLLCACISVGILCWTSTILAGRKWFLFFMCTAVSLYFWHQQVFTIRQGMAAMLFTAGIINRGRGKFFLCFAAVGFHYSFALPLFCYLLVFFVKKPQILPVLWLFAVVVSFLVNLYIANTGKHFTTGTRLDVYLFQHREDLVTQSFRWDVVVYSGILLAVGLRNLHFFKDKTYLEIVNLYTLINIFVIFIIPFTNGFIHRFAYLSWFLSPLIIFYPMFRQRIFNYLKFATVFAVFYFTVAGYIGYKIISQGGHLLGQTHNLK